MVDEKTLLAALRIVLALNEKPAAATDSPWVVGKTYFIRTVTHYVVGRLAAVYPQELVMHEASWVADTGRWHDALKTGTLNEVEPSLAPKFVGRGSIVDVEEWNHPLPAAQK